MERLKWKKCKQSKKKKSLKSIRKKSRNNNNKKGYKKNFSSNTLEGYFFPLRIERIFCQIINFAFCLNHFQENPWHLSLSSAYEWNFFLFWPQQKSDCQKLFSPYFHVVPKETIEMEEINISRKWSDSKKKSHRHYRLGEKLFLAFPYQDDYIF